MKKPWLVLLGVTIAVQGKVLSFDAHWVKLERPNGNTIYVPRDSVAPKALREEASVTAEFPLAELARLADSWPGHVTVTTEQAPAKAPRAK
jgi:hypothetical protein